MMNTTLRDRVLWSGWNQTNAIYKPNVVRPGPEPGSTVDSGMPFPSQHEEHTYKMVRQTPLVRIGIYDNALSYDDGTIYDPSGAGDHIIMQTAPGEWAQLYRAGRIYGR